MTTIEQRPGNVPGRRIGYGLVRDGTTGKPKIDGDPQALHPEIMVLMTKEERAELGLWDGDFIRDAEGIKRIKRTGDSSFETVDPVRAAGQLLVDGADVQINERVDLPAGTTFNWQEG